MKRERKRRTYGQEGRSWRGVSESESENTIMEVIDAKSPSIRGGARGWPVEPKHFDHFKHSFRQGLAPSSRNRSTVRYLRLPPTRGKSRVIYY